MRDPSSCTNSDEVHTTHMHISLTADFQKRILRDASVTLHVKAITDAVSSMSLDTSFLNIKSVTHGHQPLQFHVAPRHKVFGSELKIQLAEPLSAGSTTTFTIVYETTENCTAAQWLEPSMTVGKKYPYMFTQCQAIHARSLVPCQDTPGVKATYSAEITAPSQFRALMSAIPEDEVEDTAAQTKTWKFKQPIPIPSYLIAIAIGNIVGKQIGPRSTVWSEPEIVDAAAWEFLDTEKFVAAGESLLTPYVWGRYDLLVLPPSFPYGGMENCCLTFVTPTLLAGDRSLQDVVAHEISHSWMGNLVTPHDWQHFWLNEGFTMFIERKITGRIHGNEEAEFSAIIGYKALQESIDHFDEIKRPELSALLPDLTGGVDPDDVFSSVPYEKGYNLLYYLESILGKGDHMERYMKAHVEKFSHTSITTDDFKTFFYEFFAEKKDVLNKVDWQAWLHGTGMPPVKNEFDQTLAKACDELLKKVESARTNSRVKFEKPEFEAFSPSQKMVFLEKLLQMPPYSHSILESLGSAYSLDVVQNAEIKFRWCWLCLKASYKPIYTIVATFLGQVGRMKYVRPLYRALFKADDGGKDLAIETFNKNRAFYHPICRDMVQKDLGLTSSV
ncbi:leukotriene-A4 hydrolase [Synchytrium endobioticum]|uniref:Leukotriene-A4 hydrolase n=1 Tax=Synchytrium endobioticum TaxID=286115 RepID=A0A507D2D6_9FUNG|nr:leukotriene-A4 hydrolase [Synchytrium endobioticum]TPX45633.1 leukotriene-A4 hydrolase [Synchytrium endobioticum]